MLGSLLEKAEVAPEYIPSTLDRRLAKAREVLGSSKVLVGYADVRLQAQLDSILLRSGKVMTVATTNGAPFAETRADALVLVPPLDDEHGLELLLAELGPERVAAEPDAARQMVRACAGMPGAIRRFARVLSHRPTQTIAAMVEEITATGGVLDEVYGSLPEPAQRLYESLAVLGGLEFGAEVLAAAAGVATREVHAPFSDLLHAGLIERGLLAGRYRVLETIRADAVARIADYESAARRVIEWYLCAVALADRTHMGDRLRLSEELDRMLESWPLSGRAISPCVPQGGDALAGPARREPAPGG